MRDESKEMIKQICDEENIKCKFLSKDWVIELEKDGKTRYICGYKFDLNLHGVGLVVDDKYALYEVLKDKGIPVIEHRIVYDKNNKLDYAVDCNTYEYVKDFFIKNNNHIVIKPNSGTCGHNVFNITDINEIDGVLDNIFLSNHSISMCPFYDIKHEYRAIMLDGENKLLYAKYLPIVFGDGHRSIRELLLEFNHDYFNGKLDDSEYDRVLSKDEKYQYNWKYNLSRGSIAKRVDDKELEDKLVNLAKEVCNKINLRFGSVDIIETTNNEIMILEINSGVMLKNYIKLYPDEYDIVKNIYKSAIEKLFDSI